MKAKEVTVVNDTEYHHLPDYAYRPDLRGMTMTKALKELRKVAFGNLGGTHTIDLSDGTMLSVELYRCSDGSYLMSSQYIHRWYEDSGRQVTVRKYAI